MSDHGRGCEGRNYVCTCGYDDALEARATAAEAREAKLREALKIALQLCYNCGGDPLYLERDEATGDDLWTRCPVCREPRAAIEENQRGQG